MCFEDAVRGSIVTAVELLEDEIRRVALRDQFLPSCRILQAIMSLLCGNALVTGAGKCIERTSDLSSQLLTQRVGSGIGRQVSIAYARAGVQGITLADLNKDGTAETERLILEDFPNVKLLSVILDVTDEKSVNKMVDDAVEKFGTLDYGKTIPQYPNRP